MLGWRSVLWAAALFAFVVPIVGATWAGHARIAIELSTAADCPEHAPPPDPCPAKDTAKHVAGDCCPLMSSALALLPAAAGGNAPPSLDDPVLRPVQCLAGHLFAKDPPPPKG